MLSTTIFRKTCLFSHRLTPFIRRNSSNEVDLNFLVDIILKTHDPHEIQFCKKMLQKGADPNSRNSRYQIPLHTAVKNKSLKLTNLFLKYGADPNLPGVDCFPLHWAVRNRDFTLTKKLLKAGANPNVKDMTANTPLNLAIRTGNLPIIKILLAFQANPCIPNKYGILPVTNAIIHEQKYLFKILFPLTNTRVDEKSQIIFNASCLHSSEKMKTALKKFELLKGLK